MKNRIFNKRVLSFLLTLLMIVGVFPAGAFVVSAEDGDGVAVVATGNVAKVGNTEYTTLQAAINAAEAGQTVTLLNDVSLTSAITINKAITLDGGNFTLTSTQTVNNAAAIKVTNVEGPPSLLI